MKFILGLKKEMSQKFAESGAVTPVTAIQAGPCQVTQLKSQDKDGYTAVQIGMGHKNKINKPLQGHLKDMENFRYLREFRIKSNTNDANLPSPKASEGHGKDAPPKADQPQAENTANEISNLKRGDALSVSIFLPGDKLQITGTSKGKGFQGVVKRHGFHGAPKTHGHKDQVRMPGSIGATEPGRVFKGTRMGGHMGDERVTIRDVEVIEVDKDKGLLWVKGPVPGAFNSLVLLSAEGEIKLESNMNDDAPPKADQSQAENDANDRNEENSEQGSVNKEEDVNKDEQEKEEKKNKADEPKNEDKEKVTDKFEEPVKETKEIK